MDIDIKSVLLLACVSLINLSTFLILSFHDVREIYRDWRNRNA